MSDTLQISAKSLGELALPKACDRCFWIKIHAKKLPWDHFPGIFNTLDAMEKRLLCAQIDAPFVERQPWLKQIDIRGWEKGPHWKKYQMTLENGVILTGWPDLVLHIGGEGSKMIVDLKTAKITDAQDELFPMYRVQLSGYTMIAQSGLKWDMMPPALIYCEPMGDPMEATMPGNWHDLGFSVRFRGVFKIVMPDFDEVKRLADKALEIYQMENPPERPKNRVEKGKTVPGCEDCEKLDAIRAMLA